MNPDKFHCKKLANEMQYYRRDEKGVQHTSRKETALELTALGKLSLEEIARLITKENHHRIGNAAELSQILNTV